MNVLLDTSPLNNANSIRGVGVYTRFLEQKLNAIEIDDFHVFTSKNSIHTQQIDIIHYPHFDFFFRTLPKKKGKQKVVVTIHDVIPLLFPKFYPVGIRGKVNFWFQKQALKEVDAIITDSKTSQTDIHNFLHVPLEKIHVIYLAGNPEISQTSHKQQKEVRNKYQLPEKYILYVGDINYNKNIPTLIKALTFVEKDIHLVCVGRNFYPQQIPEWQRIASAIAQYQLQHRIHCITQLSEQANQELSSIYSCAELYIQPSLYEGFGLPILEALQCGTPVVAGKNSSLLEIGGSLVQYAEASAEGLATGINEVMAQNKKHNSGWQTKVVTHLQTFNWEKVATETHLVYRHIYNGEKAV